MSVLAPQRLPVSPRRLSWQAPLVPVALAFTSGLLLDRHHAFSFPLALALAVLALLFWLRRKKGLVLLWTAVFFLGSAYHHFAQRLLASRSLAHLPGMEGKPVRLRGQVADVPQRQPPHALSPLRSFPVPARTRFPLDCHALRTGTETLSVSGQAQVWLEGNGPVPRPGDVIEVLGMLHFPDRPDNPGGLDHAARLNELGLGAVLNTEGSDAWHRVEASSPMPRPGLVFPWLRQESAWFLRSLIPEGQRSLATALLLGETSEMTGDDWDAYLQTGVVHVLAISGQHLVILAFALAFLCRLAHVPRRRAAPAIALFLLGYALLTGGRPPAFRSALMVLAFAAAVWLRRPPLPANTYAAAWLAVALAMPGQLLHTGSLLSFLAIAVLIWRTPPPALQDPITELRDQQRQHEMPMLFTFLLTPARALGAFYLVNALVWIAITPLVAARTHLVSPVALLLGPPMVLFTSLALLSGFVTLVLGLLLPPLGALFGLLTGFLISLCQGLVGWGRNLPLAYTYVARVDDAWLLLFYLGLAIYLTVPAMRRYPGYFWSVCLLWLALGWGMQLWPREQGGFRCTFLAVGHGGCVVIEAPNGAVLLYDTGAMTGPEVTRRHVAPFLWHRGIRRIDEVLLSHGDLDHFNGLPSLLERFRVGRVSLTPSFAEGTGAGARLTLEELIRRDIPLRVLKSGDAWDEGGLRIEVMHPPRQGPEGNENARSLVLFLRHQNLTLLLTGDLEGPGLKQVLSQPPRPVDVLMAPHHGSRTSNIPDLATWANPRLVVSSQGRPTRKLSPPYPADRYLTTWEHGAVTILLEGDTKLAEGFRSGKRWHWKE